MAKVGENLPSFRLPDQEGRERGLGDLAGPKGLVLYAYPKDSTSGCTTEALEFTALAAEFAALGYGVAGVSKDSVKSHANFTAKELGITLLSDPETGLLQAMGAWGEKKSQGKVSMGTIRTTIVLDAAGKVAAIYPKVKAAGHAAAVLADLKGA